MYINRSLSGIISQNLGWYSLVYLGGPRQAGKTTLLRHLFPDVPYVNLEDPDTRKLAFDDPRRFLSAFPNGAILDEIQRTPELFSYLQTLTDNNKSIKFLLSGSQNYLMMQSISQSLAGRVGLLNLLPLSYEELSSVEPIQDVNSFIFKGGFPGMHDRNIPEQVFFSNYIQTYLERDIRLLRNIGDLNQFDRFIRLCAGRVGRPINYSTLASDVGISVNTVKAWLSLLEASYLIFFVSPYFENFNKRLIKAPKMYFFDTGMLCYLLGVTKSEQLDTHHAYGHIFENMIVADLYKKRSFQGVRPVFWYWQDQHGNEIDLLIQEDNTLHAVEIKASQTYNDRLMKGLRLWAKLAEGKLSSASLVYGGQLEGETVYGTLIPWKKALTSL